jgi:hypothetical protein
VNEVTTVKIKTSELTGAALDVAVAYALRLPPIYFDGDGKAAPYSTSWGHGGPIIQKELIDIRNRPTPWGDVEATCRMGTPLNAFGPTPLVAGMRCFVACKLGDEVDVPRKVMS